MMSYFFDSRVPEANLKFLRAWVKDMFENPYVVGVPDGI